MDWSSWQCDLLSNRKVESMLKPATILVFLTMLPISLSLNACNDNCRVLAYYMLKSCHRSPAPVAFWRRVKNVQECQVFAREKSGLAFNFSPPEASNFTKMHLPNCQILACPETGNLSVLIMDLAYDYYSAYGNLNMTENATCIKSVGLFALTNHSQNYTQSILACQNASGDLADVSSEQRTLLLSQAINESVSGWNKAAFVGLDDIETEGVFQSSFRKPLTCTYYRAWAPGHPRSKHETEDCVTLDSEQMWRTVKCDKVKLRGLCELYPQPPTGRQQVPTNVSCSHIPQKHKGKKRACLREKQLFDVFRKASRVDRCGLLNY